MSIRASGTRLTMVTRELMNQWQDTREYWQDAKSQEFDHQYMEELLATVERTVTVIDQLDKIIAKIRKDCE
jgi:hypothetical protein